MIGNISEEEILLRKRARRRLIGAITLVILAVVFLPMILDDIPQQEQQEIDIRIPSEDMASDDLYPWMAPEDASPDEGIADMPDTGEIPAFGDPDETAVAQHEQSVNSSGIPIPSTKPAVPVATPISVRENTTVDNRDQKSADTAAVQTQTASGTFVIQLGAFSDVSKAYQQKQNLVEQGINAYTETIKVGDNEMTRVRIGPFATREIAETEHEQLKKIGLSGVITSK